MENKLKEDQIKEIRLSDLIKKISESDTYNEDVAVQDINEMKSIYENNYRHKYSSISTIIQQILDDNLEKGDILSENFGCIENIINDNSIMIEAQEKEKILKLIDHINLEIGRYSLISRKIEECNRDSSSVTSNDIKTLEERVENIEKNGEKNNGIVLDAKEKINEFMPKLEKNNMSVITTLTIFSAIIMAFTGSITFASGIYSEISSVSAYRITFVTTLFGAVVINLIFMLLYIIGKLVDKNIGLRCKHSKNGYDCSECTKTYTLSSAHCILSKQYPFIFYVDIVLALILYYDSFLFFYNHSDYLPLIVWNSYIIVLAYLLPLILAMILLCRYLIKRKIVFKRNIIKLGFEKTVSFLDKDQPPKTSIFYMLEAFSKSLSKTMYGEEKSRKNEIEKIIDKLLENNQLTEKELKKQIEKISKQELLKDNSLLDTHVNYQSYKINKELLDENIKLIMISIDPNNSEE